MHLISGKCDHILPPRLIIYINYDIASAVRMQISPFLQVVFTHLAKPGVNCFPSQTAGY